MANERITVLEKQVKQLRVDKIELIRSTSTEIERLRQIIRTLTNPEATDINDFLVYTPLSELEKNKLSSNNILNQQPKQQLINDNNRNIKIETWNNNNNNNSNNNLGSLIENKSYEYNNMSEYKPPKQIDKKEETEQKTHRSEESIFRLNTKRMSYKGFEFGDFGFMTTDFDQLSRGHTQWVNQVMHHPVQNGIVITASDDWCVMFWRFKKAVGNDELKQEKLNLKLKKDAATKNKNSGGTGNGYFIDPKLQHICGEIDLLPVLKINTGLEVKGISMSSDGTILACTCYDEEEDEGNPELQLYFDSEQHWTFKHTQFNPYYGNVTNRNKERDIIDQDFKNNDNNYKEISDNETTERHGGRFIRRRIISLPFEPIPHCLSFTRDNKYVFVAMYSSITILKELNEELEEEYLGSDSIPESKWPDHPVSLCCINIYTSEIRECEKIWKYLADDEHVSCMSISPNGGRIAIGTSLGQLIVTGVLNLTNDFEDEEDFNPLLQKIWSSNDDDEQKGNVNHNNKEEDTDGSVTAIDWSPDSNWIICGHASGVIKFWKRNDKERRLSTQLNKTISTWMTVSKVRRKSKMFECKWYLEGLHIEAINSLSIKGSMMVSGADDGNVVIHDLLKTFIDDGSSSNSNSVQTNNNNNKSDNSPITIGRINKIHGGRMVNSVCLTNNYSEENLLLPSTGFFMVTSGADNIVHCVSLLDVCRQSIRQNYLNN